MPKVVWSYKPYIEYRNSFKRNINIVAIRPTNDSFSFEYIDNTKDNLSYEVAYRIRFGGEWSKTEIEKNKGEVKGLLLNTEYEFFIRASDGFISKKRLIKIGIPKCVSVVNYSHPDDLYFDYQGPYLGSPSILRLKSGKLLASHDYFKGNSPMSMTSVFESNDNAKSWNYLCDVMPCEWAHMFTLDDEVYMVGISREYGDILIGKSIDEGKSWSNPTVLGRGLGNGKCGFHRAPSRHVIYKDRIYIAVENGSWSDGGFDQCIMSANINDDLLNDENWIISKPFSITKIRKNQSAQLIEGIPFVGKDDEVYVLYRFDVNDGVVLKVDKNDPSNELEYVFDSFVPFAHTKFDVVNANGTFYAVGNDPIENTHVRNVLSLYTSENGMDWEKKKVILDYYEYDRYFTGFQYPSILVEDGIITIMSRTAFNGAHSYHDSNMMTIHRATIDE